MDARSVESPEAWRLIRTPPLSGAQNMALDEALARCLGPGEGVLRIYGWSHPTLSFGRNQPARERYATAASSLLAGHVVRRPTGGREVLHDQELTYAVVVPRRALGGPRATLRRLSEALLEAVRSLGVEARLAPEGLPSPPLDAGACFAISLPSEIEAAGRKLVGSAQARLGKALLQHGSLPLGRPLRGPRALRDAGTSLSELAGRRIPFSAAAAAVEAAMRQALAGRWRQTPVALRERRVAASLRRHYESPDWTWRR